ncbi:hypothetical protein BAE44_0008454 [Dichanthelium oligosanthes]|uniref:Fungal lipase-like domain-containing protein n=1 Tax=Dichanthelium oligosanthes TaxID=888268 RepID=A0A1E5VZL9_9POAL|nr:hypothetical protein BAE44_0008454 [Dichanthelium oligosanthes]
MGAPGVATAAGTAVLVYLVLSGRLCGDAAGGDDAAREDQLISSAVAAAAAARARRKEEARARRQRRKEKARAKRRWPERAPDGWGEAAALAARTVRFTWSETLGKWALGEVTFGIKYYMRQQGNLQHEYAGSDSVLLDGPEVRQELISLLRYLKLCTYFSKKPYNVFLEFGEYEQNDVLVKKSKARVRKYHSTLYCQLCVETQHPIYHSTLYCQLCVETQHPILVLTPEPMICCSYQSSKCFLLFIRGAISVKERLTAATGPEVPFHHVVVQEGRVSNVVLGYSHCGMVAAARWIAKRAIPCLSKAIEQFPDYEVKIIGHSMGAGIATILTYILRENEKLSSSTCIAFGPAACMTWDLAESGKGFVTTIVNRNDLVPSLGLVSAAKLRTEVMASSWAHDLRKQIQQTRFLGFVNRSVSFIRSHVPFVSDPRSKVVDVDMLQSQSSEAGSKPSGDNHAVVKKRPALVCWSCVAAQKQTVASSKQTQDMENQTDTNVRTVKVIDEAAAELVPIDLRELNLQESDDEDVDREEKESALKETDKAEAMELLESLTDEKQVLSPSTSAQERHQLYPPGRILHMVGLQAAEVTTSEQGAQEEVVALYETPRHLYSKLRLARSMIGEHYMPEYIKTMEQLIEKLAEDDIDDQLDSL